MPIYSSFWSPQAEVSAAAASAPAAAEATPATSAALTAADSAPAAPTSAADDGDVTMTPVDGAGDGSGAQVKPKPGTEEPVADPLVLIDSVPPTSAAPVAGGESGADAGCVRFFRAHGACQGEACVWNVVGTLFVPSHGCSKKIPPLLPL